MKKTLLTLSILAALALGAATAQNTYQPAATLVQWVTALPQALRAQDLSTERAAQIAQVLTALGNQSTLSTQQAQQALDQIAAALSQAERVRLEAAAAALPRPQISDAQLAADYNPFGDSAYADELQAALQPFRQAVFDERPEVIN